MLSFEEFFIKKKIDLFALKSANEELYNEFRVHYNSMGEKSFDHTKKFWFNKLRKSYLLTDTVAATPTAVREESSVKTPEPATKVSTLGFKPKSISKPLVKPNEEQTQESQSISAPAPSGFKPRFKAGVTKTAPTQAEATEQKVQQETPEHVETTPEPSNRPAGFKPRFKAGVTKTAPTEAEATDQKAQEKTPEHVETTPEPSNKPTGFKPRFKAGVIKTAPTEAEATDQKAQQETPEHVETTPETSNKKAGFKPRFKAGVTKKAPTEAAATEQKVQQETPEHIETTPEPSNKPTGFKPRFKAGVTKNIPPTDNT
ncbi:hypothetical protein [Sphingobacterium faecale]|uniref:Uncharacterized protein n=1 Tax=Sphingobacterium faecale TaxID=2803775 RepID=A0ABS1R6G0_9SPHI|nr:hypothetical protein [Sphingobacterium faecale]MBL1410263.1 hypothetical protein [Sphingobacterium faecale]